MMSSIIVASGRLDLVAIEHVFDVFSDIFQLNLCKSVVWAAQNDQNDQFWVKNDQICPFLGSFLTIILQKKCKNRKVG